MTNTKGFTMSHRKIAAAGAVAGMLMLGTMAAAWACTALATLDVNPAAGVSGQTVTGEGHGFNGGVSGPARSIMPVEVRWQAADGPLLARVMPTQNGNIKFNFTLPQGAPGYYTIIASQNTAEGRPVSGTPARATVALNNPPKQAIPGADAANTEVYRTPGGEAPSAVVQHAAPSAPAAAAPAPPVLHQDPVTVIRPASSRSSDILAPAARGTSSTPMSSLAGLMVAIGAGALLIVGAAAAVVSTRSLKARG